MPRPMWKHSCCPPTPTSSNDPACGNCGETGHFQGWQYSIYELMARYRYVYGLKPIGAHRGLSDRLLGPMRAPCRHCAGHGILSPSVDRWRACPACEGTGGVWTGSGAQLAAGYLAIIRAYPDAAAGARPVEFLAGAMMLDLANTGVLPPCRSGPDPAGDRECTKTEPPPASMRGRRAAKGRWVTFLDKLRGLSQWSLG